MGKYWKIQVWDSTELLFERNINLSEVAEGGLKEILRLLTSKYALTEEEIILCNLKKNHRLRSKVLDIQRLCGNKYAFSCGEGVYTLATLLDR